MSALRKISRHWKKLSVAALCFVALACLLNFWMIRSTANVVYRDLTAVPTNDVGLVLGTSPRLANGTPNRHFTVRIEAAAALCRAGRVKHLLLSGDNHLQGYDEPTEMKNALLALGLPASAMTLDYAGLRTLDSVARAHEIFGQTKLTIITESFHAPRAIYLAEHFGVNPVAYCPSALPPSWMRTTRVREFGARIKAVLDICVFHRGPHHLGDKIPFKIAARQKWLNLYTFSSQLFILVGVTI